MASPKVQHESISRPGYWRITNFGRLTNNPITSRLDERINVYLARLSEPGCTRQYWGDVVDEVVEAAIPVGELPRLHLNTVLHNGVVKSGQPQMLHFEQQGTRTVNCSRSNLRVITRDHLDDCGHQIIPKHKKWESQAEKEEQKGLYVAIGDSNDDYSTIIPAVEVFRFFYATSDVLTKAFLKGHFLDPGTYIWNPDKTAIAKETGQAVLWLRTRMLDADARFIARFAFDQYALRQAQEIFLSFAAADPKRDRMIRALPPFEDSCTIKYLAVTLDRPGRILVTKLISCDWRPSFTDLAWDRDNDGRYDKKNRQERPVDNWTPQIFYVPTEDPNGDFKLASTGPNVPSALAQLREEEIGERFPALGAVPAKKLPQENTKTRAKAKDWRPIMVEAFKGSVAEGRSSTDIVGKTIIEGIEKAPSKCKQEVDDVDLSFGREGYVEVLQQLQMIEEHRFAKINFIAALDDFKNVQGVAFNVYPDELDEKRKAWLYVDAKKTLRRMALLAEVEVENRVRYLIDLQERASKGCSTIVFWNHSERHIPPGILAHLLMDCAREESTNLISAKLFNIEWKRQHHAGKEITLRQATSFLERIFADPSLEPYVA